MAACPSQLEILFQHSIKSYRQFGSGKCGRLLFILAKCAIELVLNATMSCHLCTDLNDFEYNLMNAAVVKFLSKYQKRKFFFNFTDRVNNWEFPFP